jgi:flagellum-specific ATP synthase
MKDIVSAEQQEAADTLKRLLSVYRESEDLISIGAYQRGSNPEIDKAIQFIETIQAYTRQKVDEKVTLQEAQERLLIDFYRR